MSIANEQQSDYWNEQAGPRWVALQDRLDGFLGGITEHALAAAAPRDGERVLDVGCGCGATSLLLAERVAPAGRVLGADLSAPMLGRARERALALDGSVRPSFIQADAQVHAFESSAFDLCFSRFGVMFFADPPTAFRNLRGALRPGGRLSWVCWQAPDRNPWMMVPMSAAMPLLPPQPPADPDAPGPFSLRDPARALRLLEEGGFPRATLEPLEGEMPVSPPGGLEASVDFVLQIGPTSRLLLDADDGTRRRVRAAVRDVMAKHETASGVHLPYSAWLVRARRDD